MVRRVLLFPVLLLVLALGLARLAVAAGDELYVRNKPFKGAVGGSGKAMTVEVLALAKALGMAAREIGGRWVLGFDEASLPAEAPADSVSFAGKPIEAAPGPGGALMVKLEDFARVTGVVVKRNATMGTIDVFLPEGAGGVAGRKELAVNGEFADMGTLKYDQLIGAGAPLPGWKVLKKGPMMKQDKFGKNFVWLAEGAVGQTLVTAPGQAYQVNVEFYGKLPSRKLRIKVGDQNQTFDGAGVDRRVQVVFTATASSTELEFHNASTDGDSVSLRRVSVVPVEKK